MGLSEEAKERLRKSLEAYRRSEGYYFVQVTKVHCAWDPNAFFWTDLPEGGYQDIEGAKIALRAFLNEFGNKFVGRIIEYRISEIDV